MAITAPSAIDDDVTTLVEESRQFTVIRLRSVYGDYGAGIGAEEAHVIYFTADTSQRGRVSLQPAAQGIHGRCCDKKGALHSRAIRPNLTIEASRR